MCICTSHLNTLEICIVDVLRVSDDNQLGFSTLLTSPLDVSTFIILSNKTKHGKKMEVIDRFCQIPCLPTI